MEVFDYKGFQIKVEQDINPESPRDWDNLGTLVCFHRNYVLGDKTKFTDADEVMAHIKETGAIYLPVFLLDHSGLRMSTGSFGCPWDSGQVGVIFVEKAKILKEYGVKKLTKKVIEKAKTQLADEIKVMDQYLQGDVWFYSITKASHCAHCGHSEDDVIDSCGGFFGYDYCLEQAKQAVDCIVGDLKAKSEK